MAISYDDIIALLKANRSVRRFREEARIPADSLEAYVKAARYCASGRNLQPLRYVCVADPGVCAEIFPMLKWAGYLVDWDGPQPGERPAAYIVQTLDTDLTTGLLCDDGLQLEAITLAARADGVSSCIIKSFDAKRISDVLSLPPSLEPRYVLALGHAAEEVRIEPMKDGDVRYWRTTDGIFHVPKRPLDALIAARF